MDLADRYKKYSEAVEYFKAEAAKEALAPCKCMFTIPICENVEDHHRRLREEE